MVTPLIRPPESGPNSPAAGFAAVVSAIPVLEYLAVCIEVKIKKFFWSLQVEENKMFENKRNLMEKILLRIRANTHV